MKHASTLVCAVAILWLTFSMQAPAYAQRSSNTEAVSKFSAEMEAAGVADPGQDVMPLNLLGYRTLYEKGDSQQAIRIFQWNMALFPQVTDLADSLAEAYLQAGDREQAIIYLERALAGNPKIDSSVASKIERLRTDPASLSLIQKEARDAYFEAIKKEEF